MKLRLRENSPRWTATWSWSGIYGAFVLLKYLSEEAVEAIAGLFLIAAPFVGTEGWQVEEDAPPEDFASKLPEASGVPLPQP